MLDVWFKISFKGIGFEVVLSLSLSWIFEINLMWMTVNELRDDFLWKIILHDISMRELSHNHFGDDFLYFILIWENFSHNHFGDDFLYFILIWENFLIYVLEKTFSMYIILNEKTFSTQFWRWLSLIYKYWNGRTFSLINNYSILLVFGSILRDTYL